MAVLTIISVWVLSLFATAMLGWAAGRRAQHLALAIEVRHSREQVPQAAAPTHEPLVQTRTSSFAKASSSVFDNMPAVEAVRAEAKAIREHEKLWETPGILANLHHLTLDRGGVSQTVANPPMQQSTRGNIARRPLTPQETKPTLREPIYA